MSDSPLRVHVSGTSTHLHEDVDYLRAIFQATSESKAIIVRDWLSVAEIQQRKYTDEDMDWQQINDANLEALERSDVFIIDVSRDHFYTGFQVFIAAQLKKPTLVLTRSDIKNHFISGVHGKFTTIKQYETIDDLKDIVKKFIKDNAIAAKDLRFNMILNRRIAKYLRDKSYETGKNKSEIVRDILNDKIKKDR